MHSMMMVMCNKQHLSSTAVELQKNFAYRKRVSRILAVNYSCKLSILDGRRILAAPLINLDCTRTNKIKNLFTVRKSQQSKKLIHSQKEPTK